MDVLPATILDGRRVDVDAEADGRRRRYLATAALLGVSSLAYFGYAALWPAAPLDNPDLPSYMRVAADIRDLQWSRFHQRTPGYPLVMLLTGSDRHLTRGLFHAMLAAQWIAAGLTALLLTRLGVSRVAAAVVFLVGISPPYVAPAAFAATESISTLALVATFVALASWLRRGAGGMLAAFAVAAAYTALVRPSFQLLVPGVATALLVLAAAGWTGWLRTGKALTSMLAASTVTLAVLAACAFVNHSRFGQWDTSSMTARALSSKVTTSLEYLPDEYGEVRSILVKHRDELITAPYRDHTGLDYIYRALPDLVRLHDGDEVKALETVRRASLHLIKSKPLSYVHESLKLFGTYWMPNDYDVPGLNHGVGRAASLGFQAIVVAVFGVQAVVVAGGLIGCLSVVVATRRRGWWPLSEADRGLACVFWLSLAIILYTMLVSCFMGIGESRYRVPTDLLILVNTTVGITLWVRCVRAVHAEVQAGRSPFSSSNAWTREPDREVTAKTGLSG